MSDLSGVPNESQHYVLRARVNPACCGPGKWIQLLSLRRHVLRVHQRTAAEADAAFAAAREGALDALIRDGRSWVRLGPEPARSRGSRPRRVPSELGIAEARAALERRRKARPVVQPAEGTEDGDNDGAWYRRQIANYDRWAEWLHSPSGPSQ